MVITRILGIWAYGFIGLGAGILFGLVGRRLLRTRYMSHIGAPHRQRTPGGAPPLTGWLTVATGTGFAVLWLRYGSSVQTVIVSAYFAVFMLIFALDMAHRWVPNALLVPTAGLALVVSMLTGHPPLSRALLGGMIGFVSFYLIAIAYRGALGAGDVKLAGLIGLITGYPGVILALVTGIVVGGLTATVLLISGRKSRKSYIPYAPFLITGALLMLVLGTQIVTRFSTWPAW